MPQILNLSKIYTSEQLEAALYPGVKPCPHCGGSAVLKANFSPKLNKFFVFVKCEECGAQGRAGSCTESPADDDWNNEGCGSAQYWWNLRVNAG